MLRSHHGTKTIHARHFPKAPCHLLDQPPRCRVLADGVVRRGCSPELAYAPGHQGSVSRCEFFGHNRVVFNIKGNDHRLIVAVAYRFGALYVKFVGTHADYDKVDAATVDME